MKTNHVSLKRSRINRPGFKENIRKPRMQKKVVSKKNKNEANKVISQTQVVEPIRVTKSGLAKRIQMNESFRKILEKNPKIIKDFLDMYGKVKVFGFSQKGALAISYFDPKDNSKYHDHLYKISVKGKAILFVKVISNARYPIDGITQYNIHNSLKSAEPTLANWGCKVLQYTFAYNGRSESFLVAPFKEGILLEKWLKNNPANKGNGVYKRFLKIERFLKSSYNIHDLTTNNVIYNPKKDELVVIDLMPGKTK